MSIEEERKRGSYDSRRAKARQGERSRVCSTGNLTHDKPRKGVNRMICQPKRTVEKRQSTVTHCIEWLGTVEKQYTMGCITRQEYLDKVVSTSATLVNQTTRMKESK